MAASSNDSFGLKIATAFSIALSVVLLISVYFLNSNYNLESEKRVAADAKVNALTGDVRKAFNEANEYRNKIGYPAIEDFEAAKAQMQKDQDQLRGEIKAVSDEIIAMINDFQKKAGSKPGDASQYDALRQRTTEIVDSYLTNSDQSYKAQVTRLKDLTGNQSRLATVLGLNYIDLRRELEAANGNNAEAMKKVQLALEAKTKELDDKVVDGEKTRANLVKETSDKSTAIAEADAKFTNYSNEMTAKAEKREKTVADLNSVIRDIRDIQARKEDVMNKPGGRVTYVDYGSSTVRINVNKNQGVRPLMRFSIFDKNASGISSDKPKASIELIKVGDPAQGEYDTLARIIKTFDPTDPIRYNDYIFSVGWSYDHPQRFDLIGKVDINRDGRDDRADLIRMIEASGGVIEYDLPPPNVDRGPGQAAVARAFERLGEPLPNPVGRASGKISGLAYGYVTDTRPTIILYARKAGDPTKEDTTFLTDESQATKEARDNSVRPLPLEKLLNMLGYDYSAPIEGRREAFNKSGVMDLLKKKPPAPTAPATKADDAAMPK